MNSLGNWMKSDDSEKFPPTVKETLFQNAVRSINTLGLLKLWMNSRVPHMDMDPPHPFHLKHIMIY